MNTGLGVAVVAVVIVSLALRASVKVARDYRRFVVFRRGRSLGAGGRALCGSNLFVLV